MKRIANQSVYKLLGYLLLGIGAYAFLNAKQQYEHSLKVSDYQTLMQRQQNQIASLQTQLDKVDEELDKLTSVYSPYRGKVRRVKILGQNERSITAEVTLDIRDGR